MEEIEISDGPPPHFELTQEKLFELFDKIGVRKDCELCGTARWGISIDVGGKKPSIIAFDEEDSFADVVRFACVVTVCNNCGNVRTFARYILDKHLKAESKGGADV